jgi:Ribonuclease G/E
MLLATTLAIAVCSTAFIVLCYYLIEVRRPKLNAIKLANASSNTSPPGGITFWRDAELVLKMVSDYYEHSFTKAIIISSDGDYACLVKFLKEKNAFEALISPSQKCSYLLKKLNVPILYLGTQKHKLENASKRKSPR